MNGNLILDSHWPCVKLKYWGQIKSGTGFPIDEQGLVGEDVPFFKVKDLSKNSTKPLNGATDSISYTTARDLGATIFPSGTIIFAKVGAALLLNRFRLIGVESCIDNNLMGLITDPNRIDTLFTLFSLSTLDFRKLANPGAVPSLNEAQVNEIELPLPPLPQQRAIADYLDHKTAVIDDLLAEKQRLLEVLAEKRQALITQAVTRGLDGDVPLRDSGVEWLGKIPAHWESVPLKRLAEVRNGVAKGRKLDETQSVMLPYLRVANVQDGYVDLSDVAEIEVLPHEIPNYSLKKGDVLMTEGGDADKLGRGAVWDGSIDPCLHQNHIFAVRCFDVEPEWLSAVTSSDFAKAFFESQSKQSTNLASISATNLRELPVPLPPRSDQLAILGQLTNLLFSIDDLQIATKKTIGLLQERRTALIAAAVTGQIEVTE